jgi:hypothetical protein
MPVRNHGARRAWLTPLMWLTLAGLTGFLICIGSGIIPSRVTPTGSPEAFVPRRVDDTQGWGKISDYTGRYEIRPSAGAAQVDGSLVLFLRSEQENEPLIPSGTLSLHTADGNTVGYLTELTTNGSTVHATIRGGAFEGPVIGSLTGDAPKRGLFRGTIQASGTGRVQGDFVRIAKAPDYAQAQTLALP